MKRILLLGILLPTLSFGQTNRTTTAAGDFLNPLIWSPIGIPASGDSLTINHAVVMNTGIYYTAGRITIGSSGSLIEDGTDRTFWADGTGSLINSGTFTAHLLLVSPLATMSNIGDFTGVDSAWNQGSFSNIGAMDSYDILNDETGSFVQNGILIVSHDMNNQGFFQINPSAQTAVLNDFSNCNLQTMDAWFENDAIICIGNNFANCIDDTITGTGEYFIGGSATNLGVFEGAFVFNTPSGSVFNTGTIDPNVIMGTGICELGVKEIEVGLLNAYPNPAQNQIQINRANVTYTIYDVTGQVVSKGITKDGKIEMSNLNKGVYLLKVANEPAIRVIKQ
jgi:hypothetical protein